MNQFTRILVVPCADLEGQSVSDILSKRQARIGKRIRLSVSKLVDIFFLAAYPLFSSLTSASHRFGTRCTRNYHEIGPRVVWSQRRDRETIHCRPDLLLHEVSALYPNCDLICLAINKKARGYLAGSSPRQARPVILASCLCLSVGVGFRWLISAVCSSKVLLDHTFAPRPCERPRVVCRFNGRPKVNPCPETDH